VRSADARGGASAPLRSLSGSSSADSQLVKVRTLRKGNFAGQLARSIVESRSRKSGDWSSRRSVDLSRLHSPTNIHKILLESARSGDAVSVPPSPTCVALEETHDASEQPSPPSDSGLKSLASSVSEASAIGCNSASPLEDGQLSAPSPPKGWMNRALQGLGVVSALIRVRRHWVGHRRIASVRAVTQVKALVLNRDDMQWAVEHDYRLTQELQDAMRKQRKRLRAKARELRKQSAAASKRET